MIPRVVLAGTVLAGVGVALVKASQQSGVLVGMVAGASCVAFGVLFVVAGVIA